MPDDRELPGIDIAASNDAEIDKYIIEAGQQGYFVKIPGFPPTREGIQAFLREFKCQRGGECCTGTLAYSADPHHVIGLDDTEVRRLARRLGLSRQAFLRRHTKTVTDEMGDHVGMTYPCPFYEDKGHRCKVHDAKPFVCRMFPVTGKVLADESKPEGQGNPYMLRAAAACPGAQTVAANAMKNYRDWSVEQRQKRKES